MNIDFTDIVDFYWLYWTAVQFGFFAVLISGAVLAFTLLGSPANEK